MSLSGVPLRDDRSGVYIAIYVLYFGAGVAIRLELIGTVNKSSFMWTFYPMVTSDSQTSCMVDQGSQRKRSSIASLLSG